MTGADGEVRFRTVRPGPHGWVWGQASLAEVAALVRAVQGPPSTDPATTAERAARGDHVGHAADRLCVAALLRCGRHGDMLGAVLHLDRSARGLAPLVLVELCQADAGRWISAASAAAEVSGGERLAEIDAVVLDEALRTVKGSAVTDCPARPDSEHTVDVDALLDAWARGVRKLRTALQAGRPPRPLTVRLDCVSPAWSPCTIAARRHDPYGVHR